MNYPVWDVGFGLPLLIAVVATLHVYIAHFAIGGGLFLVAYETIARKRGDAGLLAYVKSHSRFFLLLTLVLGTITGVGIWFTIGLIHPAGTSALIHLFVWFWATEWVMFFVEISAAMIYFYGWEKLDSKTHLAVGWIYFITAWLSLAVINGIITFMLTPGDWLETRNIWDAFFNPTYLPSLIVRTVLALLFAGLFAILTGASLSNTSLKSRVLKSAAGWSIPALIVLVPTLIWYYNALPATVLDTITGGWRGIENALEVGLWSSALLLIGIIVSPLLRPKGVTRLEALMLLILGLTLMGSFEWYREAARKPFVIHGYMYSNGMLVRDMQNMTTPALVNRIKWAKEPANPTGRELFQAACMRCHSLTGYNGVAESVAKKNWSHDELTELVLRTEHLRGAMPPFPGNREEASKIAGYISERAADLDVEPASFDKGEFAWKKNCGLCHTFDFFDESGVFEGMSPEEMKEMILISGEMMQEMPPFMGNEQDALELGKFLHDKLSDSSGKESE